ncbi:alpha/beta fold hydrolase [Streptomyces sp. NPDC000880]
MAAEHAGRVEGRVRLHQAVLGFTEDLKRIDVPTLIAHGDDDQIVPIGAAAHKSVQLVKDATLKVYPGAPHDLTGDYEQAFTNDLLAFLKG